MDPNSSSWLPSWPEWSARRAAIKELQWRERMKRKIRILQSSGILARIVFWVVTLDCEEMGLLLLMCGIGHGGEVFRQTALAHILDCCDIEGEDPSLETIPKANSNLARKNNAIKHDN
ncbi:hypothetical protein CEXT_180701 [Caerostris extrusa]|uniref:Uncharacterized protein n=1 Tax=Caerostris extrusa TaxID=172846 RepID=A0AAV4Y2Z1_CAEEX|nr:hypothetical protein CEXT_180701 [Caerostris extrusa]